MPNTLPAVDWQKVFSDLGLTLTSLELAAVEAAYENMSQTEVPGQPTPRGQVPDYTNSPFGKLESQSIDGLDGDACALDPNAFQILRYHDIAKTDQWVRFGLQRTDPAGDVYKAFVRPDMFGIAPIDLARDAADVAKELNSLWTKGQRVVALLGTARLNIKQGMELLEPVQKLVANLTDVAYMTGGYRGESGNCYGVTRAGFDVPRSKGLETLVIMCRAGIADAHQTAAAMSVYGQQWGDDTPALSTACDGAVFFRNIPKSKIYGKWTDVEIANFVHRGKPLAILDPEATVASETHFGAQVPIFKDAAEIAAYMQKELPSGKSMEGRTPLDVKPTTMVPLLQHEQYMAVRLYFNGKEYARWVLQDDEGHKPFTAAGLKFSTNADAFEGGRDLVLDGYWKDIMLLQDSNKLPQTGDLAGPYARYRKTLEQLRDNGDDQSWWWNQVQARAIDGIWFMWPGEHDARLMAALQALPLDAYEQKVAEG
ncbi:MAG TPA: hypothetical protein VGL53_30365 [Bryobacteraceae bacterium]|jgi:hypothetical protein